MKRDKNTIELNFGPQHPAAHGVLRLLLTLSGERVVKANPHIGFLHRGTEKLIEYKNYTQAIPYFDRLDYVSPMCQEHGFSICIEKLLGCQIPRRASYIRVLFCELSRILNHLLNISSHAIDTGAITPLLWLFEEREKIMEFYERVSGSRMHANYIIPGGVAADIEEKLLIDIYHFNNQLIDKINDLETLLTENVIWKQRNIDIGKISKEDALKFSFTGPCLRASGVAWDLRKNQTYEIYNELNFSIPICYNGDCYDRYLIRVAEMKESIKIISQCIEKMPIGDYIINDKKFTPPDRSAMKSGMEDLIHHFKIYSEGFKVAKGESYVPVEAPKGEFGVFLISDDSNKPYRCKIRPPSYYHLQAIDFLSKGHYFSDVAAILGSLDVVFGEIDR